MNETTGYLFLCYNQSVLGPMLRAHLLFKLDKHGGWAGMMAGPREVFLSAGRSVVGGGAGR